MDYLFYALNGLSYGMMLFILTAGLTLVLGVMGILNLCAGVSYLVGFYVAFSVMSATNNFFLAVVAGALGAGAVGIFTQQVLLARIPKQHTPQVLLTFGVILLLEELTLTIWERNPMRLAKPALLAGSFPFGDLTFPYYRLALIVMGCLIALLLWLFLSKTKWGAILRAGRDNPDMAEAVGINIPRVWVWVFGLGVALDGLAGALGGPFIGGRPGVDWQVLLPALVIVITGGMGSIKGAFLMSIVVGLLITFGNALFPQVAMFLLFSLMVVVLAVRPYGLFGKAQ